MVSSLPVDLSLCAFYPRGIPQILVHRASSRLPAVRGAAVRAC